MSIQDFLDKHDNGVYLHSNFGIDWSRKGIGFGQFYFSMDENDVITIDNEGMSKQFIKQVLCDLVDNAVLADEPHIQPQQRTTVEDPLGR